MLHLSPSIRRENRELTFPSCASIFRISHWIEAWVIWGLLSKNSSVSFERLCPVSLKCLHHSMSSWKLRCACSPFSILSQETHLFSSIEKNKTDIRGISVCVKFDCMKFLYFSYIIACVFTDASHNFFQSILSELTAFHEELELIAVKDS